jgi:hypothetical protein
LIQYHSFIQTILKELKRKIVKAVDIVYVDRGYYSYEKYVIFVKEFDIVPIIFQEKTVISRNFSIFKDILRKYLIQEEIPKKEKIYKEINCKI